MNKRIPMAIISLVLALTVSLLAIGQQTPHQKSTMSMNEMMEQCKKHCEATSTSLDSLSKQLDDAKESNDLTKMRAALENAQRMTAEMKNHMNMCMNMMSMMGNMTRHTQPRVAASGANRKESQTARIAVTKNGFEPATISLRPNVPAEVTIIRQTDQTCAKSVVIPEYQINQDLPLNKPVIVRFTPSKTGEFGFACGMNMLKGKVVVRENG